MAQIPPEFLWLSARTDQSRAKRAADLLRWLEQRGYRPTFEAIEAERRRRREAASQACTDQNTTTKGAP